MIRLFLINIIFNKERKFNEKNFTPLHLAIHFNAKEMIEILISKGADINVKNDNIIFS